MFWWRNHFDQSNLSSDSICIITNQFMSKFKPQIFFQKIEKTNDYVIFSGLDLGLELLKIESFAFLDKPRFMITKLCKARITALDLSIRVSSFLPCFSSLVNATPRYLIFSTCFSVAPFTCNTHWPEFLERWSTSVLVELIFIPAVSHVAVNVTVLSLLRPTSRCSLRKFLRWRKRFSWHLTS